MSFSVQSVIDRMRQVLNEQSAGLYTDSPANLIQCVSGGMQQFYRDVLTLLRQQGPVNPHHHFVRWFIVTDDDRLPAGVQDIGPLTDVHDETLSVGMAQPEAVIGGSARHYIYRTAMPVAHVEEAMLLVSRNVGVRQGLAAWHPYVRDNVIYIRTYSYPGRNGVPLESTPYRHIYLRTPDVLTATSSTVALPTKYMDPLIWYGCAHAVPRERKAVDAYLGLAQAMIPGIAGVLPQPAGR